MTDVLRFSKKAFTWSVVGLTILWSMGAAALLPLVAQAEGCVLEAGDLFKVKGTSAVYYVNGALKRVPFFHANHFKTLYQDYSGVVECDASATAQYPLSDVVPTTINMRAGELWKLVSEPAVYMVVSRAAGDTDPRSPVCQLASEQQASDWKFNLKADVLDLPDYLNGNFRKLGMCVQPNGLLVSNPGSNDVYLVSEGQLWKVDGALPQFLAKEVHVVATGLPVATGSITPASIVEKSLPISNPSVVVPSTGALSVSLAGDTPAAASVVNDLGSAQAMIPVLKVNMVASGGSVTVNSVKFTRGGISADTEINNAHLYKGDMWVASNPSISNGVLTFSNAAGLFSVSGSESLTLKMDLKNSSSGGKSLNFMLSDMSVAGGSVAGLPLAAGNTFTTVNVTDLGYVTFSSISPSAAATVDPGLMGYEIWRFQGIATDQDMEVRRLRFTVVGSVSVGDLKNFSLWNGATQVGVVVPEMSADKTVTFDLSAAPFQIPKGQTKQFSLKTDIVGGTNRSFRASLQNDRDLVTYDKEYKVFVKANGSDSFSIIEPNSSGTAVNYTVNTGSLTQSVATTTPTGNVADGSTNVTLAEFKWTANGEDVKVSSLYATTTGSDTSDILANVRLLVNGSQVGTTDASVTANGGGSAAGKADFGTFGNSFIIKAGTSAQVKVVADLTDTSVASGATFIVGLGAGTLAADAANAQGVVSLSSITSVRQVASTLTVQAGTVSVVKNSSFGDRSSGNPTGPVNGSQVLVGSFSIIGGSGEDVDVSQISVKDDTAGTCIGTYMQNLTLMSAAGAQLGVTYANPSTSCATANTYTFNLSPAVTVKSGEQYVVNIYADLKAAYTGAASLVEVDSVTASGKNTGTSASASSQALSLQAVYISTVGAITVAIDADTTLATNLLMGAVDQNLGKFKLTANNVEGLNLTELVVSANLDTSYASTGTLRNIRLFDEGGSQIGSAVASLNSGTTSTYANAKFSSLNLSVPKGATRVVTVKADITPYEAGGFTETNMGVQMAMLTGDTSDASGVQLALTGTGALSGTALTSSEMTFTANAGTSPLTTVANGSSTQVTANVGHVRANEFVLYRAKLTVAWAGDAPSGLGSPAAAQTVGKFVVSNAANVGNYSATVNYVNFGLSTTISNTAARELKVYKDSLATTALWTTSFAVPSTAATAGFTNTGNTDAHTESAFTDVEVSSGANKTFFVTLDTTDAASTKTFSVTIPSSQTGYRSNAGRGSLGTVYGLVWTDGVTATIAAHGGDVLPLAYKTFTY